MVYIHRETFDMIRTDLSRIMQSNDYFAADELIAPSIQVLNRKGYITEWCCSGHPFIFVTEGYFEDDPEHKLTETQGYSDNTYISFKEGVSLPTIPPGFNIEERWNKITIRNQYQNNPADVYAFSRYILETAEQLYEWALNLPEFSPE